MASRDKTREVFIELINLQLKPHNKTYEDVVNVSDWYMKYTTTREKEQIFIKEGISILMKKLRMSKTVAEREINWFILQWGLTTNGAETDTELIYTKSKQANLKRTKK